MQPAPVGVQNDFAGGLGGTSTGGSALLPWEGGMGLGGEGSNLLAEGHRDEREGDESGFVEHFLTMESKTGR